MNSKDDIQSENGIKVNFKIENPIKERRQDRSPDYDKHNILLDA